MNTSTTTITSSSESYMSGFPNDNYDLIYYSGEYDTNYEVDSYCHPITQTTMQYFGYKNFVKNEWEPQRE